MRRLIAEVWKHPQGFTSAVFYCHDAAGELDRAMTHTLLSLIEESGPPIDAELEALVAKAELGHYSPRDPSLPDWGVNDKNVWLVAPTAEPGRICISNENTGEYSSDDGGQQQQFTYEQFRAALEHWREFRELMAREGKDKLIGRRFETVLPE